VHAFNFWLVMQVTFESSHCRDFCRIDQSRNLIVDKRARATPTPEISELGLQVKEQAHLTSGLVGGGC